ncbi:hypothetical protein RUND412_004511 [Rhizina undulata]
MEKNFHVNLTHEGAKKVAQVMVSDFTKWDRDEHIKTRDNAMSLLLDDTMRWTKEFLICKNEGDQLAEDVKKTVAKQKAAKAKAQEDCSLDVE